MKKSILCILFYCCFSGLSAQSRNAADSLIRILNNKGFKGDRNVIYQSLIRDLAACDLPEARKYGIEWLHDTESRQDTSASVSALKSLFNISAQAGDYEEAIKRLERIDQYSKQTGNPADKIAVIEGNARIALEQGNFQKAIENYQSAIRFNEQHRSQYPALEEHLAGDYLNYAIALLSLAYHKIQGGALSKEESERQKEQILEYMRKALQFRISEKDTAEIILAYNNISIVYQVFPDRDSALFYTEKALELSRTSGDLEKTAHSFTEIARLYKNEEDFPTALRYYNKALSIYKNQSSQRLIAGVFAEKAQTYQEWGKNQLALGELKKALPIFEKINNRDGMMLTQKLLSQSYEALGNYPMALAAFKTYSELSQRIFGEKSAKELAWIKTKFDTEAKEHRIITLEKNKALADQKIKNSYTLLIVSSLVILIMVFILITFRLRMKTQKSKAQIERQKLLSRLKAEELKSINKMLESREKERQRIAYELHDRLGVMLATTSMLVEKGLNGQTPDLSEKLLKRAVSICREASEETRRVAQELSSPVLQKFGLSAALKELARNINEAGKMRIELQFHDLPDVPANVSMNIYRILQELVANSIKHSGAEKIYINSEIRDEDWRIIFRDNGKGIESSEKLKGMGWKSIYSRLENLGGEVFFPEMQKGFSIVLKIPALQEEYQV